MAAFVEERDGRYKQQAARPYGEPEGFGEAVDDGEGVDV